MEYVPNISQYHVMVAKKETATSRLIPLTRAIQIVQGSHRKFEEIANKTPTKQDEQSALGSNESY